MKKIDASGTQSAPFAVPEIGSGVFLGALFKMPRAYLDALFKMLYVNITFSHTVQNVYIANYTYLFKLLISYLTIINLPYTVGHISAHTFVLAARFILVELRWGKRPQSCWPWS